MTQAFREKTTSAPLLFWKINKIPAGVHCYTPAPVHHCPRAALWRWRNNGGTWTCL